MSDEDWLQELCLSYRPDLYATFQQCIDDKYAQGWAARGQADKEAIFEGVAVGQTVVNFLDITNSIDSQEREP